MAGRFEPPFFLFLGEEKEKTGRSRSKKEKDVWSLVESYSACFFTREDRADLACFYFRCRFRGGWRDSVVSTAFFSLLFALCFLLFLNGCTALVGAASSYYNKLP